MRDKKKITEKVQILSREREILSRRRNVTRESNTLLDSTTAGSARGAQKFHSHPRLKCTLARKITLRADVSNTDADSPRPSARITFPSLSLSLKKKEREHPRTKGQEKSRTRGKTVHARAKYTQRAIDFPALEDLFGRKTAGRCMQTRDERARARPLVRR